MPIKPHAAPPDQDAEALGRPLDPAYLEVFRHYLLGAAEEIWHTLRRTAYSINIKERGDCSSAIFNVSGETLAIPPDGVPLHQGSLSGLVFEILQRYELHELNPGDMIITNDAYTGGTHANDYCVVAPVHVAGEVVAFVANVGHHSDVGGRVGCSISPDAGSVFEEGLLVPPIRLVRDGKISDDVLEVICHNSRERAERRGDIRAQVHANRVGTRRLRELIEDRGRENFDQYAEALLTHGYLGMRRLLESMPDGEWQALDYLDGDGAGSGIVPIRLVMRKDGGELTLDWSDAPAQCRSGRNVPFTTLCATCFCVLRGLLDPEMSLNSGFHRTVRYVTIKGSLVDPEHPSAVGDRATTCQVLADVVANCVSQMSGERQLAGSGSFQGWAFEGRGEGGRSYTAYESVAGGRGATESADGMDGVRTWPTGSMNAPIEAYEQDVPAVFRKYELRQDSGGAGKFQGGLGLRRDIEIRGHDVRLTCYTMRQVVPPPGLGGGRPGIPAVFVVNPDTSDEVHLPPVITDVSLKCGDIVSCRTPGGGGVGPCELRDRDLVQRDIELERISEEFAAQHYGWQRPDENALAPAPRESAGRA